jgi:hypothetical protein
VKDELLGKKIKCPKCKQPALVGGKDESAGDAEEGLMGLNLDSYRDAEGEGEPLEPSPQAKAPKKKRKKSKNAPLPGNVKLAAFGFSILSLAVLAGLVTFVAPAIMENIEAKASASAPGDASKPGTADAKAGPADAKAAPANAGAKPAGK